MYTHTYTYKYICIRSIMKKCKNMIHIIGKVYTENYRASFIRSIILLNLRNTKR